MYNNRKNKINPILEMPRVKGFDTIREGSILYFIECVKDRTTGKRFYTYYKKKVSYVTFPGIGYMTINFKGYPTITLSDDLIKLNAVYTKSFDYYDRPIYSKMITTNERLFIKTITKTIKNMYSKMPENIFKAESTNIIRKSGIN